MNKGFRYAILTTIVLLLASCSSTKYVPDGSYLLDEVRIHTDNKEVKTIQSLHVHPPESQCEVVQPDKDPVVCLQLVRTGLYTLDKPYIEEIR